MKRILLPALAILTTATAYAQPTLTGSAINPVAGDVYFTHSASMISSTVGASGAAVTWDYSELAGMPRDTAVFVDCTATPFCDSFAGSDLATVSSSGDYTYFQLNSSTISVAGMGAASGFFHFADPYNRLYYPLSYHTGFKDTAVIPDVSGCVLTMYDSSYSDAYGTLILPSGTYTNAMRVYSRMITAFTVPGIPTRPDTNIKYTWYNPGFHGPLMEISLGNSTGLWEITRCNYYTRIDTAVVNVAVNDAATLAADLKIYPNPVNDVINVFITLNSIAHADLTLSDVTGKTLDVRSADLKAGNNELSMPVPHLQSGMYLLCVRTANETITNKISVVH